MERILITNTDVSKMIIIENDEELIKNLNRVKDYFIQNNPYITLLKNPISNGYDKIINSYKDYIFLFKQLKNKNDTSDFYSFFGDMILFHEDYRMSQDTLKRIFITVHQEIDRNPELWYAVDKILKEKFPNKDWSLFNEIMSDFTNGGIQNMDIRMDNIIPIMEQFNFYAPETVQIFYDDE